MVTRDPGDHPGTGVAAAELIAAARALIGKPYKHQGRGPSGFDCIGLILNIAQPRGLLARAPGHADYGRVGQPELERIVRENCDQLPPWSVAPAGAMVLIRWPGANFAQHCALCAGETLIHCCGIMGKVVEHGYRGPWLKRTQSLWWIPGVTRG